jgi:hypothetical protein
VLPTAAQAKASARHDPAGRPYRSFRGLLEHLATLTRNQVRFAGAAVTVPMLAEPTSTQRQAFELIGTPIPLTPDQAGSGASQGTVPDTQWVIFSSWSLRCRWRGGCANVA